MPADHDAASLPVRHPDRTDTATAEMDAWVLDVLGMDMNALPAVGASFTPSKPDGATQQGPAPLPSGTPSPAAPASVPSAGSPEPSQAGEQPHGLARQVVTGVATGVYRGGKSLLGGLADLERLVLPFTEAGMIWQLVDPHAPTAQQSIATVSAGAKGAYSAASHPVVTFNAAHAAVQDFRKQFEAERAEAEKKGTTAEFYSQFTGRAGFEIISAIVPAGKLAEGLGIAAKAAKGAEVLADAGRDTHAVEAAAKAESLLAKAREAEPALTRSIQGSAESQGGKMVGLEHRLKTPESLARKIEKDCEQLGLTAEEAGNGVRDAIRYTATFPPDKLVAGAQATLAKLKGDGCVVLKLKNTWLDASSSYKGVNVQLQGPNGQVFELQFHTPDSFRAKEVETHAIYEEMRKIPMGSPEWQALNERQMEIARKLQIPDNIEALKEIR